MHEDDSGYEAGVVVDTRDVNGGRGPQQVRIVLRRPRARLQRGPGRRVRRPHARLQRGPGRRVQVMVEH